MSHFHETKIIINNFLKLILIIIIFEISGIGDISLGKRLGFLQKLYQENGRNKNGLKDDEFVKAVHEIFVESANLYVWPAKLAKKLGLKSWKNFYSAVETALKYGT